MDFVESPIPLVSELPSLAIVRKDEGDFERSRLRRAIYQALDLLTAREKFVIECAIIDKLDFDEIGEMLNVTAQRISQIRIKALRKLRHPSRSSILRDFADYRTPLLLDERGFWRMGKKYASLLGLCRKKVRVATSETNRENSA